MVKHTQTIRLSVFDHFVGLALKELNTIYVCVHLRPLMEKLSESFQIFAFYHFLSILRFFQKGFFNALLQKCSEI